MPSPDTADFLLRQITQDKIEESLGSLYKGAAGANTKVC
jgi:hypothetical protein